MEITYIIESRLCDFNKKRVEASGETGHFGAIKQTGCYSNLYGKMKCMNVAIREKWLIDFVKLPLG